MKLNKKWLISLLVFTPALVIAPVLSLTSCSKTSNVLSKEFVFEDVLEQNKTLNECKDANVDFEKLLFGGKKYSGTYDYIVVLGTDCTENGGTSEFKKWLFNDYETKTIKNSIVKSVSDFIDTQINESSESTVHRDIKFFVYNEIDIPVADHKWDSNGDECEGVLVNPYTKWSAKDQSKDGDVTDSGSTWWKNHSPDDYIRNDAAAKEYRKLVDDYSKVYEGFMNSENTFGVFGWLHGYHVSGTFNSATASFRDYLNNNFNGLCEADAE